MPSRNAVTFSGFLGPAAAGRSNPPASPHRVIESRHTPSSRVVQTRVTPAPMHHPNSVADPLETWISQRSLDRVISRSEAAPRTRPATSPAARARPRNSTSPARPATRCRTPAAWSRFGEPECARVEDESGQAELAGRLAGASQRNRPAIIRWITIQRSPSSPITTRLPSRSMPVTACPPRWRSADRPTGARTGSRLHLAQHLASIRDRSASTYMVTSGSSGTRRRRRAAGGHRGRIRQLSSACQARLLVDRHSMLSNRPLAPCAQGRNLFVTEPLEQHEGGVTFRGRQPPTFELARHLFAQPTKRLLSPGPPCIALGLSLRHRSPGLGQEVRAVTQPRTRYAMVSRPRTIKVSSNRT